MPSKDPPHPLAVPMTNFRQFGYPVSDSIGTYLGVLLRFAFAGVALKNTPSASGMRSTKILSF